MKRLTPSWDTLLIVAIMLVASVCAQSQQLVAAQAEAEEGRVVQIAPGGELDDAEFEEQTRVVEEPNYWIGVRGNSIESDVLRTHLQLAEDMGVVVEDIIPNSPAAKAGLRKHDIILRANGDAVENMQVLQSLVRTGKEKPLELRIIRLGKKEKVIVVPELRPDNLNDRAREMGQLNGRPEGDLMQQLMQQFGARNIGPGMVFRGGQAFNFNQMPSGVSVSIQRQNDGPAQITVKKGDKTWQIEGDDKKALAQLPDDVRPFVERMLNGQNDWNGFGQAFELGDMNAQLREMLPRGLGEFQRQGEAMRKQREAMRKRGEAIRQQFDAQEDQMRQRMEQLEKQLKQLQQRFEEGAPAKLPPEKTS